LQNHFGPNTIWQAAVLIGANNSGKPQIVEALALSLGRDRFDPQPTEQDFYGSKPEMLDRIEMIGIDFEPNEPSLSSGLVSPGSNCT
jgi:predicted ATP-dependent endonuclease of OLD family